MNSIARHIQLSWIILEHKWRYYEGPKYGVNPVSDSVYDALEDEYRKLCTTLGQSPTAADMVGFDYERVSCRVVAENMRDVYKVTDKR